jgi:GNAT superfamily N-acetyltransferase
MQPEDVPLAERLSAEAFYDLDMRIPRPYETEPKKRPPERAEGWNRRTLRFLDTDPEGCVVAVDEHGLAGFATSIRREDAVWGLVTFAVRPGLQGQGVGKRILSEAIQHGAGCPRWMLSASDDPKAVRRYRLAGFDLHPQMALWGQVDRSALPNVGGLREGSLDDVELLDRIDRVARGAGHGPDHEVLASMGTLVVDTAGRGYAYAHTSGPALLAALDEETAVRLLWECLARTADEHAVVGHVTAANQWALDVGLAGRLTLGADGYLGIRGTAPPTTYLHNGALL